VVVSYPRRLRQLSTSSVSDLKGNTVDNREEKKKSQKEVRKEDGKNNSYCCRLVVVASFVFVMWSDTCISLVMDMLLKKDVGHGANHATSNTPWVSGRPNLVHKHNRNKTQVHFVNNGQIAVIFVRFNLDSRVT
jgi:hypothetical protein